MVEFDSKEEMEQWIHDIKEYGLEEVMADYMNDEFGKDLLHALFSVAFDRLSDEDYETLVLEYCEQFTHK